MREEFAHRNMHPKTLLRSIVGARRRAVLEQAVRLASYTALLGVFMLALASRASAYVEPILLQTETNGSNITIYIPLSAQGNDWNHWYNGKTDSYILNNATTSNRCDPINQGQGTEQNTEYGSLSVGTNFIAQIVAGCPSGIYYWTYQDVVTSQEYYFSYSWNGTQATTTNNIYQQPLIYEPTFVSQYNTKFTAINFGTTTNSVDIDVSYYIDSSEATTTQADKNPTQIRFRYSKRPQTSFNAIANPITDAISPSWGYGTTSVSLSLDATSTYDINIQFANSGTAITGIVPFPLANVYFSVTTDGSGGIATTSNIEYYDAVIEKAFEYQPCGITDIGGCINNSFLYLFYPSNETLDRFASLKDELQQRSPFVYVYQIPQFMDLMFESAQTSTLNISATTSIGSITFLSKPQLEAIPLTATIRTIIGYLLWVMLAFMLYRRITGMFNHQEKPV